MGLTAASVAVAVAIAARTPSVLHDHALAAELFAVQLVNGVVGVAGVLELHEAVPGGGARAGNRQASLGRGRARARSHYPRALPRPRAAAILEALPRGAAALALFRPAEPRRRQTRGVAGGRGRPGPTHPFLRSISRRRP